MSGVEHGIPFAVAQDDFGWISMTLGSQRRSNRDRHISRKPRRALPPAAAASMIAERAMAAGARSQISRRVRSLARPTAHCT